MRLVCFFRKKDILKVDKAFLRRRSGMLRSEKAIPKIVKNIFLTVIGTLVLAFGSAVFILPYHLITGGVSGLAIILSHLIPTLSDEIWVAVLSWTFFAFGYLILGKSFALKTLLSTIVYPVGVMLFSHLSKPEILNGFFNLSVGTYSEIAVILAAVFGGCLIGIGCGITFLGGGSTGGVDIISLALCKWFPQLKCARAIFFVDALIILMGILIAGDFAVSLLGILTAFVGGVVIEKILLGQSRALIANVFSDAYEAISADVIRYLDRTATLFDATGAYSKGKRKMLMIIIRMNQYRELLAIISRHDKNAFVTVFFAHEINGEGWKPIKEKS